MPNIDYILATKFQGTITSEEDAWLNSWLNESDENKSIYKQASKLWDELGFSSSDFTQDRQVAWEMIVSSIKPEATSPKPQLYKLIVNMVVVIVALFVVMGIASTFLTYNANQQEVAKVRNHRVALPDRSDVYLDSLASVKYAKRMGKNSRTISVKGNAVIEALAPNKIPLTIKIDGAKIVLENGITAISNLKNGATYILALRGSFTYKTLAGSESVQEQEMIVRDSTGTVAILPADLNFIAWRTGVLSANETPARRLVAPIEALGGIPIFFSAPADLNKQVTFTVKPASFKSAVDSLAKALGMNVRITSNRAILY